MRQGYIFVHKAGNSATERMFGEIYVTFISVRYCISLRYMSGSNDPKMGNTNMPSFIKIV